MTVDAWLDVGLWIAAGTNAALLGAGLQVPVRYSWRLQMRCLDRFTARVFWSYAGFVAMSLVAFSVITALLHDAMLAGERSATVIAAFMALWWTARLVIDILSFGHRNWPEGTRFVLAHALLIGGFTGLAVVYWIVVIRAI
jgi:hypothetical protein